MSEERSESIMLPLSGVQHVVYCERQCALIHVERIWRENALTVKGRVFHERVDGSNTATRGETRIARALPLVSFRLGLIGKSDVVEFHRDDRSDGAFLPGVPGRWRVLPVEYKRGRPKSSDCDRVQLCAQAMCLEEMLGTRIETGALFYGKVRRREPVTIDPELRATTERAIRRFREIYASTSMPSARRSAKCRNCSLLEACQPPSRVTPSSVGRYMKNVVEGALQ